MVTEMKMQTRQIYNLNIFKILGDHTNEIYFGCDQEWYTTEWQRLTGCGPSVASHLIVYLLQNENPGMDQHFGNKEKWQSIMEESWEFVTPNTGGIATTKMFYEAFMPYAASKGLNLKYEYYDVDKYNSTVPSFSELISFLEGAFVKDSPIAFLNLCNGREKNLDEWHWVTIVLLEYDQMGNASIEIMDEGLIKKINLKLWYETTTLGGGFVYFTKDV